MSDIATLSGVAKGTLYNHFRTKEAVYLAAVEAGVTALGEECVVAARDDLADALAIAAERLASHPALRRIATDEPATHAALVSVGTDGVWATARACVSDVLLAGAVGATQPAVDVVLRWLASFVGMSAAGAEEQARVVVAGLPVASSAQGAGPA
jgi:AcrR family transcriptional regulator